MKKNFKKLSALLLTMVFSMGTMVTAFAAEPHIKYQGEESKFAFETSDELTSYYTTTDLFEKFKNVMPGDQLEETIVIENTYTGCDYITLYMDGMLHHEKDNPISEEVLKELTADERRGVMSELEYMNEFLDMLTLTVKHGEKVIYAGSPSDLDVGFEGEKVLLGTLNSGDKTTLNVTLEVPIEMGNEFANRIGEVDWIFVVEQGNNGGGGGNDPDPDDKDDEKNPEKDPEEPPLVLGDEDVKVIEVTDSPKTGDDTVILPYVGLFAVGLVGMILTAAKRRKREE